MRSWTPPTAEDVARAVAKLVHPQQQRYFFDRLDNPKWVKPLHERRWFSSPPAAVRDAVRGSIQFPPWPQGRYLARMAVWPEARGDILRIVASLETDNELVHEDIADIALAVPAADAARLVPRLVRWLRRSYRTQFPKKVGELITHLARAGEGRAALKLAAASLKVRRDRRVDPDADRLFRREATSVIDPWQYEQIVERHVPSLVEASGVAALELLSGLLDKAVGYSRSPDESKSQEDYSEIWRPNIEFEQFRERTTDLLVSAVRDAAIRIVQKDPARLRDCVTAVLKRRWLIFERIAIDLVRQFGGHAPELLLEVLGNEAYFDHFGREYRQLLREAFRLAPPETQSTVLRWIDQGPRDEGDGEADPEGPEVDEAREQELRRWRYRRLVVIGDDLPGGYKEEFGRLKAEFGKPVEESHVGVGTWVGPSSPLSLVDLQRLGPEELIKYLREWKASGDPLEPTPEGLGRILTEAIAHDPSPYAEAGEQFIGLDPTYVRAVFAGLERAQREKKGFSWPGPLHLLEWALAQKGDGERTSSWLDRDPGWGWSRTEVARLLEHGLMNEGAIASEHRTRVWAALSVLAEDPNPSPEHEAKYGGTNMDPVTLSINTTRGEAMHAAMRYALWVRSNLEKKADAKEAIQRGFAEMPEVASLLERHLDPSVDPSLAIRSIYGKWFPWLIHLDADWARAHIEAVFPKSPEQAQLWAAAWDAYINYSPPYNDAFHVMEALYVDAVERLPVAGDQVEKAGGLRDSYRHLAEHLVVFYGRGKVGFAEEGSALARFFTRAGLELRSHALRFAGRSISETPPQLPLPPDVIERFRSLWEWRVSVVRERTGTDPGAGQELRGFGTWFGSGRFDGEWAFAQLETALTLGGRVEQPHLVLRRLTETVGNYPEQSVRALRRIVETDRDGWALIGYEDEARTVLTKALESKDAGAIAEARSTIHRLGELGLFSFKALLEVP